MSLILKIFGWTPLFLLQWVILLSFLQQPAPWIPVAVHSLEGGLVHANEVREHAHETADEKYDSLDRSEIDSNGAVRVSLHSVEDVSNDRDMLDNSRSLSGSIGKDIEDAVKEEALMDTVGFETTDKSENVDQNIDAPKEENVGVPQKFSEDMKETEREKEVRKNSDPNRLNRDLGNEQRKEIPQNQLPYPQQQGGERGLVDIKNIEHREIPDLFLPAFINNVHFLKVSEADKYVFSYYYRTEYTDQLFTKVPEETKNQLYAIMNKVQTEYQQNNQGMVDYDEWLLLKSGSIEVEDDQPIQGNFIEVEDDQPIQGNFFEVEDNQLIQGNVIEVEYDQPIRVPVFCLDPDSFVPLPKLIGIVNDYINRKIVLNKNAMALCKEKAQCSQASWVSVEHYKDFLPQHQQELQQTGDEFIVCTEKKISVMFSKAYKSNRQNPNTVKDKIDLQYKVCKCRRL